MYGGLKMDLGLIISIALGVAIGKVLYDGIHDVWGKIYWTYDRHLRKNGEGPYEDYGSEEDSDDEEF